MRYLIWKLCWKFRHRKEPNDRHKEKRLLRDRNSYYVERYRFK